MILTCPACGAGVSLEAWANDKDWREFVAFFPQVPMPIQARAIAYLGLWRTGKRALKPAKALKILAGLLDLVKAGTVHWEHGETRPAPIELWAKALDAVIERRPSELNSHNYLKHTAWDMAAGLAAESEKTIHRRVAESAEDKERPDGEADKPKRRGCFRCESFRPPKGCGAKSAAVSGNLMLGCGKWTEKAGTGEIGGLMQELTKNLQREEGDKNNEQ
jgi:hypothetical protein